MRGLMLHLLELNTLRPYYDLTPSEQTFSICPEYGVTPTPHTVCLINPNSHSLKVSLIIPYHFPFHHQ
jgi:hypothetical protein